MLYNTDCVTEAECDQALGEYLIILLKITRKAQNKGMAIKVGGRKTQYLWGKLGIALRLGKREERHTFANINGNEVEWLNIDCKNRNYFTELGTLFLWETAP